MRIATALPFALCLCLPVRTTAISCLFDSFSTTPFFCTMHVGLPGTACCEERQVFFLFTIFFGLYKGFGPCSVSKSPSPIAPSPDPSGFNIFIEYVDIPDSDRVYFQEAKERWERIVTNDVRDVPGVQVPIPPLPGCTVPEFIDDLYMCAKYDCDRSDGPGMTVGAASIRYIRASDNPVDTFIPISGYLRVDPDDVEFLKDRGLLGRVVLHEMGHLLGIGNGTPWLQVTTTSENGQCNYLGENAKREFAELNGGCDNLPLLQSGGDGSICRHWADDCLRNELMSSTVSSSETALSKLSVGVLQDIGYDVDYSEADEFSESDLGTCPSCRRNERDLTTRHRRTELSSNLYDYAVQYGRKILEDDAIRLDSRNSESDEDYVGSQLVRVYVMDGDRIHGVTVTTE